ncbi:hypothetical protein DFH06DRAFT_1124061 [Mycena polygramma]|nr:hypothetical protein DFH06DRAFT_1124061 [Mycena polygramma]
MNSTGPPAGTMVSKVVAAAGPVKLRAYMEQMFSPELVAIGYYTADNAETWLDVEKFMRWLTFQAQKSTATPPATPSKPRAGSSSRLPPSSSPAPDTPSSSLPPIPPPQFCNKPAAHPSTSSPLYDSDDDAPPAPQLPPRKRKRGASAPSGSDSDCVETKELREQRKTLKATSGVKKSKRKGEQARKNFQTKLNSLASPMRKAPALPSYLRQPRCTLPRTKTSQFTMPMFNWNPVTAMLCRFTSEHTCRRRGARRAGCVTVEVEVEARALFIIPRELKTCLQSGIKNRAVYKRTLNVDLPLCPSANLKVPDFGRLVQELPS